MPGRNKVRERGMAGRREEKEIKEEEACLVVIEGMMEEGEDEEL